MFIKTTGRQVVVCGGGEQAAQKARLIAKTDAQVVLAAPVLKRELTEMVEGGQAVHHSGALTADLFADAAMAFVATGCPGADAALHAVAQAARVPVNVVDQPDLCDVTTPSIVDRDPVIVAIGTEGTAPLLARQIKTRIEQDLSPNLGDLAALAGRLRSRAAHLVPRQSRRGFWRWVFAGGPRQLWEKGAEADAEKAIEDAMHVGAAPDAVLGRVSFVGAGPGIPDLLTLRAVQRLQEADVVFFDIEHAPLLELARRDAERVRLAPLQRRATWPEDATLSTMKQAAARGEQVVRLVATDPADMQKCHGQAEALQNAGVSVEEVPGVLAPNDGAQARQRSNLAATG